MQKTATFDGYIRASADQSHPLQTKIQFIFTDFSPNKNRQGIPLSEAENIINSGRNMPIKINYRSGKAGGHDRAIPIGTITNLYQEGTQILSEAILWKDEFKDIIDYLEQASETDKGVQFSWELYFKEAATDSSGVSWLSGCLVAATAIVADPAYGGRTRLIALAEDSNMDTTQLETQVSELTDKLWSMMNALYAALALPGAVDAAKGIEEQFSAIIDAAKSLASAKAELQTTVETTEAAKAEVETALVAAKAEADELRQFKHDVEEAAAKAELTNIRRDAVKDFMTPDEFSAKAEFILGLTEGQLVSYVESLAIASAKSKPATNTSKASAAIPDPITSGTESPRFTIADLAKELRSVRAAH